MHRILLTLICFNFAQSYAACSDKYLDRILDYRQVSRLGGPAIAIGTMAINPYAGIGVAMLMATTEMSDMESSYLENSNHYMMMLTRNLGSSYQAGDARLDKFIHDVDPLSRPEHIYSVFYKLNRENAFCDTGLYNYDEVVELVRSNL